MRIDNSFFVAAPPERLWQVLLDVPKIAPCLPGARLTEVLGADRYKGEAAVKLGPVQLQFGGEARLSAVDPVSRSARVTAKGADRKGRGSAAAVMNFVLSDEDSGTRVSVETDLTLTGTIAQYGRASGLIKEIANELIGQFATNLGRLLADNSAHLADATNQSTDATEIPALPPTKAIAAQSTTAGASISAFRLLFVAIARIIGRRLARAAGRDVKGGQ
jgi:uncharacterized protein